MADKIYCYPNTNILINKLNIHDQGQLLDAETRIVSIRLYQLYEHQSKDIVHPDTLYVALFLSLKYITITVSNGFRSFPCFRICMTGPESHVQ